jgi:cytochrome c biogenesis protein CcmG, thiol:disulfide interchange protein DsbE
MTLSRKDIFVAVGVIGALIAIALMAAYSVRVAQRMVENEAREKESIGKTMPEFAMPVLQQPGKSTPRSIGKRDLLGRPYLLHGWASWCKSCREEHPAIRAFAARSQVRLIGYNVDDEPELALRWLERYGDPYEFSLVQATQQTPGTIPLTSTPQLILIDSTGVVRWRHLGISTEDFLDQELRPALARLENAE